MLSNNFKKAFTILELLVVITIIGVVSIVAIPNVRAFLAERETRSAVFAIANIAESFKSNLESGLSQNSAKKDGGASGTFVMGVISLNQFADNFSVITNYRSDQVFRTVKTCDFATTGGWEQTFRGDSPDFKNIVTSDATESPITKVWMCLAKVPTSITSTNLTVHICSTYNNRSRSCGTNFKNDPIYRLSIQRLGNVKIERYNYTNKIWNVIQK